MSYQVFARKYRPQNFAEVVGQESVTLTLKNSIKYERIAQAYIFSGPRGIGKTSVARIFAKALNCLERQPDFEPCNKCENCKTITDSNNIDVIEIDGASHRGIEEIRGIRGNVKFPPTSSKYKIYIIDEFHQITGPAFNALLKTLEEPPPYIVFIFATTEIHKVIDTILSRCQKYFFNRIIDTKIIETLRNIVQYEKVNIDEGLLLYIARKSGGCLRDAESLLDQIISFSGENVDYDEVMKIFGIIDVEVYFNVIDALLADNYSKLFNIVNEILQQGRDFNQFLGDLLEQFHLVILSKTLKTNLMDYRKDISSNLLSKYISYAEHFTVTQLRKIIGELINSINLAKYSNQLRILVEVTLFKIIEIKNSIDIENIVNKLSEFEQYFKKSTVSDLKGRITESVPEKEFLASVDEAEPEIAPPEQEIEIEIIKKEKSSDILDFKSIHSQVLELLKDALCQKYLKKSFIEKIKDNKIYLIFQNISQLNKNIIEKDKSRIEKVFSKVIKKKISLIINYSDKSDEGVFDKLIQEKRTKVPQKVNENKIVKTILKEFGGEIVKVE